jgi:3-hydroxyisobutyrate dehydrogenase
MGHPMAGHLAGAGHAVRVYNRTRQRAQAWCAQHAGTAEPTPAAAARDAEFVFLCSGNDDDVREVVCSDDAGALAGLQRGAVLVDHTTGSAQLARELAAMAADRGLGFLDAPVSGGQAGAENGALTIMVGGAREHYDAALPLMRCYAKKIQHMGPAGSGQLTKMVNQICIAGVVQGLSEALRFAERSGLDAAEAVEVISQGAAQSWQMDNRAATMLEGRFDFGFAVDWMRKDLGIALDEARRNGSRLPLTALVDQFYAELQARGSGRLDTSSLIELL